jgi:hypothetical protein
MDQSSWIEVMLIMGPPPPRFSICLAASWVPKKALFRLMFNTLSYCASMVSGIDVRVSTRVVHHDIDTSEFRNRCVDQLLQVGDLADVSVRTKGAIAQSAICLSSASVA